MASAAEGGDTPVDPPTIEVGARAFLAQSPGHGTLGVGLEGVWRSGARFGLGVATRGFLVTDSEYGEEKGSGWHVLALGEVHVFPGWITPYARLAVGGGRRVTGYFEEHAHPVFAADLEGGLALRGGPFVLRGFVGPSLNGRALLFPVGLQLGGAFDAP